MIFSSLLVKARDVKTLFSLVRGNARVIVFTEGISNIAFQWYSTFLPLYMVALGLDEVTIGWLASAYIITQFLGILLGGVFADKYGRKKVIVIGDILCWGIPLILYSIAQNPWFIVAGRLINGFIYVVFPSFECLFVEDVSEDHRPAVFSILQFLLAAGSLLAPLAGLLVSSLGMVTAGRIIMFLTALMAIGIAIFRNITLVETSIGNERISVLKNQNSQIIYREYLYATRLLFKELKIRNFLILRILTSASTVIWNTYAMIFLTSSEGAKLPEASIALVPTISSIVTIFAIFISADRIVDRKIKQNMIIGQGIWLIGAFLFLWSPYHPFLFAGIWTIFNSISQVLFQPAVMSHWANIVDDRQRAIIFSTSTALITLCTIPVGPLAGYLYQISPGIPFILSILIQIIVLILIFSFIEFKTKMMTSKLSL